MGRRRRGHPTAILNGTMNGDVDPTSTGAPTARPRRVLRAPLPARCRAPNIGDLLNNKSLTWGWFQGGFTPSSYTPSGQPICATAHVNIGNSSSADYSPHHEPFQYYESTSNPDHVSPANTGQVGTSAPDGVNHQYDLTWFNQAVAAGDMPAVSYLKAPEYEDGHAGYSDPLDEQRFIVSEINEIEQSPDWASTAIFIAYDDSDGWYDHQMGPIIRGSQDAADALNGPGKCGGTQISTPTTVDRCGSGPRLPLLVVSPWAKQNFVDNTFTDQASIPKFIEQNWDLGGIGGESADSAAGTLMNAFNFTQRYGHAPAVIMDPSTGEVTQTVPATRPSTTSTTSTTSSAPSGSGSGNTSGSGSGASSGQTVTITLPKLDCKAKVHGNKVTVTCTTKGGSKVSTALRLRAYRAGHLIANHAATVHNHRATFGVKLNKRRTGDYRFVVTVDAGGKVGSLTRSLRVG